MDKNFVGTFGGVAQLIYILSLFAWIRWPDKARAGKEKNMKTSWRWQIGETRCRHDTQTTDRKWQKKAKDVGKKFSVSTCNEIWSVENIYVGNLLHSTRRQWTRVMSDVIRQFWRYERMKQTGIYFNGFALINHYRVSLLKILTWKRKRKKIPPPHSADGSVVQVQRVHRILDG